MIRSRSPCVWFLSCCEVAASELDSEEKRFKFMVMCISIINDQEVNQEEIKFEVHEQDYVTD